MFPFNLILIRPVQGSRLYHVVCLLLRESQQHLGVSRVIAMNVAQCVPENKNGVIPTCSKHPYLSLHLFSPSWYSNCCKISSACIELQISAGPCGSWNSMGLFLFTDDIYPLISFWKHDSFSLSHGECTYRTFFSCHV